MTSFDQPPSEQQPEKKLWYRSSLFNAFVIGAVGFLAPGMWNAMSSLGAGGAESPFLVNAANALVFGLMGIFCVLGGPIANRIGLKYTLTLGAVGYPVYSAGLYANNRYGNVWLVLVGAVTCGISAGLFWASEGAVALGYPEPAKRGKYMNIWLWFRTGGPLVGGAIVLGLNHASNQKKKGKVGYAVYIIFITLQCLAAFMALALSPPDKAQRSDGSKIKIIHEKSFKAEIRALIKTCARRDILLLLLVFWAAYFNQYSGNYEVYYFGVRARALIGFVGNFANLFASQIMSMLLDYKEIPVKQRLNIGFYYVIFWHLVAWIYAWVVNEKFGAEQPDLDWTDGEFTKGFFVILLWSFSQQSLQNWLYYFVSTKTDNISELSRFAGILRGQESFAQAVSFGINTRDWYRGRVPMAVNTILLVICLPTTYLALREHIPVETPKDYGSEPAKPSEPGLEPGYETSRSDDKQVLKLAVGQTVEAGM
ncbi:uncharacterized protein EAF01_011770 [Botrytis porri]|uniref:Major facilitator superfamily (MFS) profile domain-containing protein n=1 Tax=Botrytis porri TaxID=87229 RepID=A0A4Z1KN87_9HELO|nr:uncharacterized protein EAF01_011770 [Botrytis porri]KAF7881990.1 hypothetical protein EAF01_011770 [Botrytis porri]TGO87567.1 hypothetical protein BPOR_0218g00130 [Botrytis porri]